MTEKKKRKTFPEFCRIHLSKDGTVEKSNTPVKAGCEWSNGRPWRRS